MGFESFESNFRSYKNGFVWHDLGESDFICPAHGHDYVLKGSEIPQTSIKSEEEELKLRENCEFPILIRRRNQSWSSLDLNEYKVYKSDSHGEYALKAADASTQTDEKRRTIQENDEQVSGESLDSQTTELSREEISPPPSSSSPETLETLIKADGCISRSELHDPTDDIHPNTKAKASTVLKQFLSCGPFSSRDAGKDQGFSLVSHYESRLPRGPRTSKGDDSLMGTPNFAGMSLEDKEYFSGSLIETKKEEFAIFKRSSSYNADRSSKLELREKEIEGVRAKCIPRRPKNKKESKEVSRASSQQGSKRHGDEEPDK
ncbi:hypothetical protein GIB67_015066 [Kingdonia uniflora]|uniref:SOSEKI DIX-like domain-containing protein n=1 Tax=Kingdonia uniflora TaxID=39325 RepID=A0A7J7NMU8_9MAGN|nr:hypothetical protein GIB67_015066 [Kingdonia uniflora]